jgi:hypothetical protein
MIDDLAKELGAEDWPKGLYMIFAKEGETLMCRVIGLTRTTAKVQPWDLMFGGIDEDVVQEIVLAEWDSFHAFDDLWDMDDYHDKNYPLTNTGEANEPS